MKKGFDLRLIINNILYEIYKEKTTLDSSLNKYASTKLSARDKNFIFNVCLNSMRFTIKKKILKLFTKKKCKLREEILLYSAITQIVFLNFKSYGYRFKCRSSKKKKCFIPL